MTISDNPRKAKKTQDTKDIAGRQQLLCPKCGHRVIDQREGVSSQLHVLNEGGAWMADYFLKCQWCKSEIGLRKIG